MNHLCIWNIFKYLKIIKVGIFHFNSWDYFDLLNFYKSKYQSKTDEPSAPHTIETGWHLSQWFWVFGREKPGGTLKNYVIICQRKLSWPRSYTDRHTDSLQLTNSVEAVPIDRSISNRYPNRQTNIVSIVSTNCKDL